MPRDEYSAEISYEPSLLMVPSYAEMKSLEAYPTQHGQDDQRDAYRHMLAAGILARKYGTGVAEMMGKLHELKTSPLAALKSLVGVGSMPHDYEYDLHNNQIGASMGNRVADQSGLERLLKAMADKSVVGMQPGRAALPPVRKASGGLAQYKECSCGG